MKKLIILLCIIPLCITFAGKKDAPKGKGGGHTPSTFKVDEFLKDYNTETVYETHFDQPLKMIHETELTDGGKEYAKEVPEDIDWVMEGAGIAEIKEDGRLHLINDQEQSKPHLVFWNTRIFPENYIIEWDFKHETPTGTAIVFFSAHTPEGKSIHTPGLPPRTGKFGSYTKGKIRSYHISYSATDGEGVPRKKTNFDKNTASPKGNSPVQSVPDAPIDGKMDHAFKIRLVKVKNHIVLEIDGQIVIDAIDENTGDTPPYGGGQFGLRHMSHTIDGSYGYIKVHKLTAK